MDPRYPPEAFADWQCSVVALDVQRTFWEKATILHTEYHRPAVRPRQIDSRVTTRTPPRLRSTTLRHQRSARIIFGIVSLTGRVDFSAAGGRVTIWPNLPRSGWSEREKTLRQDYAAMRDMYLTEPVSFDQIIATLVTVERQIKSHRAPASEAD